MVIALILDFQSKSGYHREAIWPKLVFIIPQEIELYDFLLFNYSLKYAIRMLLWKIKTQKRHL